MGKYLLAGRKDKGQGIGKYTYIDGELLAIGGVGAKRGEGGAAFGAKLLTMVISLTVCPRTSASGPSGSLLPSSLIGCKGTVLWIRKSQGSTTISLTLCNVVFFAHSYTFSSPSPFSTFMSAVLAGKTQRYPFYKRVNLRSPVPRCRWIATECRDERLTREQTLQLQTCTSFNGPGRSSEKRKSPQWQLP